MHRFRLWLARYALALALVLGLALCLNGLAASEHQHDGKAHPFAETCSVCAAYHLADLGLAPSVSQPPLVPPPTLIAHAFELTHAYSNPAPFQARAPPAV